MRKAKSLSAEDKAKEDLRAYIQKLETARDNYESGKSRITDPKTKKSVIQEIEVQIEESKKELKDLENMNREKEA